MRLTKLEIQGFKSFARKTELQFDRGITAVIGPNGSGKSNIADAVRWVLGEQSAKALRGARMEDVIFNGTETRKPQAYCEVQLTFDNTDGTLPVAFSEVTVARRVYRSGESEYAINRNGCRLKDIQELFRDTGVGKEGYSIIGQGRVEEILSNKSNDRRVALEEAAGVMRYRVRKEDAVRKLDHTKKNLERLEDILEELNRQRGPLKEQADKARTYLQLHDELKNLDLNVFLHQYERAQERLVSTAAAIEQLQLEAEEQLAGERALLADHGVQEEQLRAVEKTAAALQNTLLVKMSSMEAHAGEGGVLKERKEHLEKEFARLSDALTADIERREALRSRLEALEQGGADGRDMLQALDEKIGADQAALQALQQEIDQKEIALERQKSSIIEHLNRLSDAKSQLSRMEAMEGALHTRMDALGGEVDSVERERAGLLAEHAQAGRIYEEEVERCRALMARRDALQKELASLKESAEETGRRQRALEQKLNAMRSRASVLEEMARAHEGYYASVRNVMRDCGRDLSLKRSVLGVVAELIQVPEEFEIALEMALGSALQHIVTPTPDDAKRVIEHLRKNQYGRATMLPLSAIRPRVLNAEERESLQTPGCIGVASDLVGHDPAYRNIVENLLGRTVIVEDLAAGIALNKRARAAFRIATRQGDIIHPGGSMTGGSVQKREFSLLGRERETKQLQGSIEEAQTLIKSGEAAARDAFKEVEACEARLSDAQSDVHAWEVENVRHKEKVELILRDMEANARKMERAQLERSQIQDHIAEIDLERKGILDVQSGIEEGSAATQADVQQSQAELNGLRAKYERSAAELTEQKVRRMALQKEDDAALAEQKRLRREREQLEQAIETCKLGIENSKAQSEALDERITLLFSGLEGEQKQIEAYKEQQQEIEEERQKRAQALTEARANRDAIAVKIRDLEERKHKQELLYNRAELEFAAMQERILGEYELTYETALPYRQQPFGVTAAYVRIDELRREIKELGSINVNAVEDYNALFERYEGLRAQCDDLNKAEADLQTLIEELTATMERQFLGQFQLIQQHFREVFKRLFGGGWAELRLSDPKDVLNCEIDIIAQPPGKKLQLLSLLSGGERALTAIALLFAMLKLKPTVFCILDEIESSLDEVNVNRFAQYLSEYAEDTQFILITHRKGSMEACDTLYGVAMEEKGVSKIVSARLHDVAI